MIDLRDIVRQHGGDLYAGGRQANIPAPGHSKHDRSLSLTLSDDGERIIFNQFSENGGSVRAIMAYLGIQARVRPQTAAERARYQRLRDHERRVRQAQARAQADADRALCRSIWEGAQPAAATPVESYLWGRGLIVEASDVAFHPAAPRSKDPEKQATAPAMVCMVRSFDGRAQALHLTYLRPGGTGRDNRLMFGSVSGHAVQLAPLGRDRTLAVAEGIETAASYMALRSVPTWAALSTSGLQGFVIPPGLRRLIIAADGDKGGDMAARALAERARRTCEVEVHAAPDGDDWNDVLRRSARG